MSPEAILDVLAVEERLMGPVLHAATAPREGIQLARACRGRLYELLRALRDLNFLHQEEYDFLYGAEFQLVVEGAERALRRYDKYYEKKRDLFGDGIDWTDDKSVFKEERRR